jgi:hypothetical protein
VKIGEAIELDKIFLNLGKDADPVFPRLRMPGRDRPG